MPEPRIWIGTSGYVYPHWRRGVFYPPGLPQKDELEFYARHFRTVELNNPFYRLPEKQTFVEWRRRAPLSFLFAVKASRYITHMKKLKDCREPLHMFLDRSRGLGNKLGPILFQFPRMWGLDLDRLREFLRLLPRRKEFAFEFRHPSWLVEPVYAALRERNAALCLPVGPGVPLAPDMITADFTYIRMHGGSGEGGNFAEREIRDWRSRIAGFSGRAKVYVYFNNDQYGFAIKNAARLRELLVQEGLEVV